MKFFGIRWKSNKKVKSKIFQCESENEAEQLLKLYCEAADVPIDEIVIIRDLS